MSNEQSYVIDTGITLVTSENADESLVERINAFADREANIDMITGNVMWLVEHDRFSSLEHVLDGTGYTNNRRRSTSEDLGVAILALLPVVNLDRVLHIAEVSNFEVARSQGARTNAGDEATDENAWERAGARLRESDPDLYRRTFEVLRAYAALEAATPADDEAFGAAMASLKEAA